MVGVETRSPFEGLPPARSHLSIILSVVSLSQELLIFKVQLNQIWCSPNNEPVQKVVLEQRVLSWNTLIQSAQTHCKNGWLGFKSRSVLIVTFHCHGDQPVLHVLVWHNGRPVCSVYMSFIQFSILTKASVNLFKSNSWRIACKNTDQHKEIKISNNTLISFKKNSFF